jgi:hypothetical protein
MNTQTQNRITKKSYKVGTYATSEFYLNGEFIHEIHSHKNECGVSWFNELPSEDDAQHEEIGLTDLPADVEILLNELIHEQNN